MFQRSPLCLNDGGWAKEKRQKQAARASASNGQFLTSFKLPTSCFKSIILHNLLFKFVSLMRGREAEKTSRVELLCGLSLLLYLSLPVGALSVPSRSVCVCTPHTQTQSIRRIFSVSSLLFFFLSCKLLNRKKRRRDIDQVAFSFLPSLLFVSGSGGGSDDTILIDFNKLNPFKKTKIQSR